MAAHSQVLAEALEHHRAGRFGEAEKLYRRILQSDPHNADALHLLGLIAHEAGRDDAAIDLIGRAIRLRPDAAAFYSNLGLAYQSAGRPAEAIDAFRQALILKPDYAEAHNNLGAAYRSEGRLGEAKGAFREALRLRPDFAEAHSNLGQVLQQRGLVDEALASYRRALELKPNFAEAYFNLASVYAALGQVEEQLANLRTAVNLRPKFAAAQQQLGVLLTAHGRLEEALPHLQAWSSLQPGNPEARVHFERTLTALGKTAAPPTAIPLPSKQTGAIDCKNRADALLRAGRVADAVAAYQEAIALRPDYAVAYNDMGNALQQLGKLDEAIKSYFRALEIDPKLAAAHSNLGVYFRDQGELEAATAHFEAAQKLQPSDTLRVLLATLLPPIYESEEDIERWRRRLIDNLKKLGAEGVHLDPGQSVVPNLFYLAYQGGNDRDIQRDLANLYAAHMSPSPPSMPRAAGGRLRVGLISKYFKDHTIGVLMRGLVAQMDRSRFELFVLAFDQPRDWIGDFLKKHADRYVVLADHVSTARQAIAGLGLDVLFYADIGMDPGTYSLAFARLAPVQCVTWGHPLTTGIPTIDYFISSDLIEPPGAEDHYTETLIRLKTLPFYYYRPVPPAPLKPRNHFGLPAESHVYGCLQTLFKFHPRFDEALGGVLRRDPQALVVVIKGKHPYWEELLLKRWSRTLADVVDRIRWLPPQKRDDFLNLMAASDVLLDTFPFSGGNTSYEGLALGVPIVTLAAPYMRGRITYALYKKMDVMDCVADDVAGYVEKAVRLGTDANYRKLIGSKIAASSAVLFEDIEAVRELESFFLRSVEQARRRQTPLSANVNEGGVS